MILAALFIITELGDTSTESITKNYKINYRL